VAHVLDLQNNYLGQGFITILFCDDDIKNKDEGPTLWPFCCGFSEEQVLPPRVCVGTHTAHSARTNQIHASPYIDAYKSYKLLQKSKYCVGKKKTSSFKGKRRRRLCFDICFRCPSHSWNGQSKIICLI
jgi:hypothetical protein